MSKICINYDAVMKWLELKKKINSHKLEDIEWVRDDGKTIEVNPRIIEDWNFVGMSNIFFLETHLSRIVEGEGEDLLQEIIDFWKKEIK